MSNDLVQLETLDDIDNLVFLCDRLRSRLTQVSSNVDQLQQIWINRRRTIDSDARLLPILGRKVTKSNEILLNIVEKFASVEIQTESLQNLQKLSKPKPKTTGLSQRLNSQTKTFETKKKCEKIQIQMQNIRPGTTWNEAEISIVDHPSAFFVTNQNPNVVQQFQSMSIEMNHFYKNFVETSRPLENVSIGDFCATRFSEDGLWYRARVAMNKTNSIHIVFIDYGNSEEKSPEEIYPLDESFAQLPAMAVACTLTNSFPQNEIFWNPEATNVFRNLVKDRLVQVNFEPQLRHLWPLHFVKVTIDNSSVSQHPQLASYLIPAENEQIALHFNDKLTSVEYILYNIGFNDNDILYKSEKKSSTH